MFNHRTCFSPIVFVVPIGHPFISAFVPLGHPFICDFDPFGYIVVSEFVPNGHPLFSDRKGRWCHWEYGIVWDVLDGGGDINWGGDRRRSCVGRDW